MNIPKTEQVKLKESKAAFAVGINCEKSNSRFTVDDTLELETMFVIYNKHMNGTYSKAKKSFQIILLIIPISIIVLMILSIF